MRFEQFISGATLHHHSEAEDYGIEGDCLNFLMYHGNTHIVRSDGEDGAWCLTVENKSEISNDILMLEAELYCWAADEGIFDDTLTIDTLFNWMIARKASVKASYLPSGEAVCTYLDFDGVPREIKHPNPKSSVISAWCKDTVREYFHNINRSVYSIDNIN